jgi:hypothetical protein
MPYTPTHARAARLDSSRLDRVREVSGGQYLVDAVVGVVGPLKYEAGELGPDAPAVVEYVDADTLFDPDSVESLRGAPVTIGHPPGGVGPDQPEAPVIGSVADVIPDPASGVLRAVLRFWTRDAVEMAKNGVEQLSLGYDVEDDGSPGVAPDGTAFDRRQVRRIYNHTAQVQRARAGHIARLRFDGKDRSMFTLHYNGKTFSDLPGYVRDAFVHHAIDSDGDSRADFETAMLSIEMDGEKTDLVLPRAMVEEMLQRLGALDAPAPEEEIVVEDEEMEAKAEVVEDMKPGLPPVAPRSDADFDAAVERAVLRREKRAAERARADAQCSAMLPASYDRDAVSSPNQLRADALGYAAPDEAKRAKKMASRADAGDQWAAGWLEAAVEFAPREKSDRADEGVEVEGSAGSIPADFDPVVIAFQS